MRTSPKIQFTSKATPQQVKLWNETNEYKISLGLLPKLVWVNPKQMLMLNSLQKTQGILMGRGGGKSYGMHFSMAQKLIMLPKGSFFLAAPSFEQLLSMSLKGLEESWGALGWEKDRDYHFFKPPLEDWEQPHKAPQSWKNCIAHRSGGYIQLLSGNKGNTRRGGSFDGGDLDEVGFMRGDFLYDVVYPSLRGNIEHFFGNPLWQVVRLFSSMPRDSNGMWFFDIEEQYKQELELKGVGNTTDFLWLEGNAYDNIAVWGEAGIERLRRGMPHLKFEVEVMNRRIQKAERAFYNKYNPDYHAKPFPIGSIVNPTTGAIYKGLKQLKRDEPVDVSFDFGGWFTCCLASQFFERENIDRTYQEFFRDGEDMLRPVVHDVCKFLDKQGQRNKMVYIYGEPRGHNPNSDGKRLYQKAVEYFNECGYRTEVMITEGSKTDEHAFRFENVNEMLAETNIGYPKIEINIDGCPNLSLCLQSTAVNPDYRKDKSKEKDRNFPQHLAPHLTDAFDYKAVQKFLDKSQYDTYRPNAAGSI